MPESALNRKRPLVSFVFSFLVAILPLVALSQPAKMTLKSPVVAPNGKLPVEFTGDGAGISPPLEWSNVPQGTREFVLIMHHVDPQGIQKWYWTLYHLKPDLRSIPKASSGDGDQGTNSVNRRLGYAPPHSQGPGVKHYTLTLYALSEALPKTLEPAKVNRATLLQTMRGKVLGSAELIVNYERGGQPQRSKPATIDKPNILFILGEAQGRASMSAPQDEADLAGSASRTIRTPNLDRLAASGIRYSRFYAASPRCTPTRVAFFTGVSPAALHMTFVREGRDSGNAMPGDRVVAPAALEQLPTTFPNLATLLKQQGYTTAHFGKWHMGRTDPTRYGFDESDGPNNNGGPDNSPAPNPKQAVSIAKLGAEFIERQAKKGAPFYLQISQYPSRGETVATPETIESVRKRLGGGARPAQIAEAAAAEEIDKTIGQVLAKVKELGIEGRTYVIYSSDHGAQGRSANGSLRGGKGTIWDGGLRVPFIVSGPGVKPGSYSTLLATSTDLLPTIADLAGVERLKLPRGIEGSSLVLNLLGEPVAPSREREEFVFHFPHYDMDPTGPASAIISGAHKLVRIYETNERLLFDLAKDPSEQTNLATKEADLVRLLDDRLTEYLKRVKADLPIANLQFDPKGARSVDRRRGGYQ